MPGVSSGSPLAPRCGIQPPIQAAALLAGARMPILAPAVSAIHWAIARSPAASACCSALAPRMTTPASPASQRALAVSFITPASAIALISSGRATPFCSATARATPQSAPANPDGATVRLSARS